MVSSKVCFKCKEIKPLGMFYKHPAMADGHVNKCTECNKKDVRENRLSKVDYYRAYDTSRAKLPNRIKLAKELNARWRKEDRRREKCHNAVTRAIKKGTLDKENCCVCGSEKSMAHHESYDKPLEVIWYCQIHHKARHKEMAIAGIET